MGATYRCGELANARRGDSIGICAVGCTDAATNWSTRATTEMRPISRRCRSARSSSRSTGLSKALRRSAGAEACVAAPPIVPQCVAAHRTGDRTPASPRGLSLGVSFTDFLSVLRPGMRGRFPARSHSTRCGERSLGELRPSHVPRRSAGRWRERVSATRALAACLPWRPVGHHELVDHAGRAAQPPIPVLLQHPDLA